MRLYFKRVCTAAALSFPLFMSLPTHADPGIGIGFSYVFGEGASLGLKVFSDDEEDKGAAEIGIDYVFPSQSWRPHVGAAYLGNDYYVDVNLGYSLGIEQWNVALGAGYTNTDEDKRSTSNTQTDTATDEAALVDDTPDTDLVVPEGGTDLQ
jgi:hypothetical protein